MNLKLTSVKRLFEPKLLDKLQKALARDKVIIDSIKTIIDSRLDKLNKPTKPSDFDKSSWALYRAFLDGKKASLYELKDILKESKKDEGRKRE